MKLKAYKYGLSNTLEEIENVLSEALNTNNKIMKQSYIREAYGMIKAIDYILTEEDDEDDYEEASNDV